ncbi:hypothetical protein PR048_025956 [Dryococelus australis]|uniref:Uncharacterized protein n=1 Tax=Dryococelus australis TaxID=614101 RepID=A0ABQ9GK19_9NEOP|nr:hypothetical protein PR048_025956 [Dryococelus australis]
MYKDFCTPFRFFGWGKCRIRGDSRQVRYAWRNAALHWQGIAGWRLLHGTHVLGEEAPHATRPVPNCGRRCTNEDGLGPEWFAPTELRGAILVSCMAGVCTNGASVMAHTTRGMCDQLTSSTTTSSGRALGPTTRRNNEDFPEARRTSRRSNLVLQRAVASQDFFTATPQDPVVALSSPLQTHHLPSLPERKKRTCYDLMGPRCYDLMGPRCYDLMGPRCYDLMGPRCYDIMGPRCYDLMGPRCYDLMGPRCYDLMGPRCYALSPLNRGRKPRAPRRVATAGRKWQCYTDDGIRSSTDVVNKLNIYSRLISAEDESSQLPESHTVDCCNSRAALCRGLRIFLQLSPVVSPSGLKFRGGGGGIVGKEGGVWMNSARINQHINLSSPELTSREPLSEKGSEHGAAPDCKGCGNGKSLRKPADQRHRPPRFPRTRTRVATPPGIEPGSPWWEASLRRQAEVRPTCCQIPSATSELTICHVGGTWARALDAPTTEDHPTRGLLFALPRQSLTTVDHATLTAVLATSKTMLAGMWSDVVAKRVRFPAGSLPDFRTWESCRTTPLVGVFFFLGDLPFPPALAFRRCSIGPTRFTPPLSALKTSMLRDITPLHTLLRNNNGRLHDDVQEQEAINNGAAVAYDIHYLAKQAENLIRREMLYQPLLMGRRGGGREATWPLGGGGGGLIYCECYWLLLESRFVAYSYLYVVRRSGCSHSHSREVTTRHLPSFSNPFLILANPRLLPTTGQEHVKKMGSEMMTRRMLEFSTMEKCHENIKRRVVRSRRIKGIEEEKMREH